MKILIFAGTTEGRRLSEILCEKNVSHLVSVATEYGRTLLKESKYATVFHGRMDEAKIENMLSREGIDICIDATHPFATDVTKNIREACENAGSEYIRLLREGISEGGDYCKFFNNHLELLESLKETSGNILLTIGSKDIHTYCQESAVKDRLYVRVLPGEESIRLCNDNGINGNHIIAMQGPFSYELNKAIIKDFDIKILVSKQSGKNGGYDEKLLACMDCGIEMYVIGLPDKEEGLSLQGVCERLNIDYKNKCLVSLVGIGVGNEDCLTIEAKRAIEEADIIFGAKRVIEPFVSGKKSKAIYMPDEIVSEIKNTIDSFGSDEKIAVLFSGDSGFFSGAKGLISCLKEYEDDIDTRLLPGISSVSYFSSQIKESYDDAAILSIHGRYKNNWEGIVRSYINANSKTFILLSGKEELFKIKALLKKDETLIYGRDLALSTELIGRLKPEDESIELEEGLFIVCILNPSPGRLSGYIRDDLFIRDKVPMTKSAIRTLSISRLCLDKDSVLYDIGAGSGSVSIEAALLYPGINVFSIEKKSLAIDLIKQNIDKFNAKNISVIEGEAPDILKDLPRPTHVFIGGSSGNMKEIVSLIYEKNHSCRLVINAVSLETLEEILKIKDYVKVKDFDIMQVLVTNTKSVGSYNMMNAQNPVWICEMELCDNIE